MARRQISKAAQAKRYDDLFDTTFEQELAKGVRENAAADYAYEVVRQRRHADEMDSHRSGLPSHETPIEHMTRLQHLRVAGHTHDEARALMFAEDVRAMKTAQPDWDADRCAQEIRDRGFYQREGYQWSIRVARAVLGTVAQVA